MTVFTKRYKANMVNLESILRLLLPFAVYLIPHDEKWCGVKNTGECPRDDSDDECDDKPLRTFSSE
jgi:hypothetical protein